MSANDALLILKTKLRESFGSSNLELYGIDGKVDFNFSLAADNIAGVLFKFFQDNGRMPNLIFNDGLPASFGSLKDPEGGKPLLISVYTRWKQYGGPQGENQTISETVTGSSHFNVPVMIRPTVVQREVTLNFETGASEVRNFTVSGPFLNKPDDVPWSSVEYGAFQTWGIMIVAVTHPEYLFATDEGIMLTRDGVMMIDRSLAYWLERYLNLFGLSELSLIASMDDFYVNGPIMFAVPFTIVDKLKHAFEARAKAGRGITNFFKFILQMIMTFVGFYFGAAAASGLVGGAYTIPNMTGALSLAQRFGLETGQLGLALKLIGLTMGNTPFDTGTVVEAKGAVMDDEFWSQIGIDPNSIDYSGGGMDFGDLNQFVAADYMNDPDFWAQIGIDPNSISYNLDGLDTATVDALISGDYGYAIDALDAFGPVVDYDAVAIQAENDAALARAVGPMSATQYAAAAKASPSVATAAQAAMKQAGGSAANVKATPQQAAQAQQVAKQNATAAKLNGDNQSAGVWGAAGQLLKMYGEYQLADKKLEMQRGGTLLPSSTLYPATGAGSMTRQPDGSITIRNADGTMTTVKPNGQVVGTPAGGALPAFLSDKKILIAGGIGLAVVAAIAVSSRNRR